MNSRGYLSIPFTVTNPTTAPFLQLATPTNAGIRLMELFLGEEAGETAEQATVTLQRRTTASTLPTAATIVKLDPTDGTTRLVSSTTTNAYGIATATGTAGDLMMRWTFDVRTGLFYAPSDLHVAVLMDVSGFMTLQFPVAPAANIYSGYVIIEEM